MAPDNGDGVLATRPRGQDVGGVVVGAVSGGVDEVPGQHAEGYIEALAEGIVFPGEG
jgi:hypothetical protein